MRTFFLALMMSLAMNAGAQTKADSSIMLVIPKYKYDSVRYELNAARYQLLRVRYYVNITINNPRQDKFLKGWIIRALR